MAQDNTAGISSGVIEALSGVTTATLTTLLLKKGLRSVWMRGTRPLQMEQVDGGAPLPGLYPPNDETRARDEAARSSGR